MKTGVNDIWQDPHVPFVYATITAADLQLQRQLCKYRAAMAEEAKRQAVEKQQIKPDTFSVPQGKAELSYAADILLCH